MAAALPGAPISSTATGGNWNAGSTWVGGKVPADKDDVTIVPGASVTVTNNTSVHNITFGNTGASTAVLTVNSNATLTAAGAITAQSANNTNTSALIQGAGMVTCMSITVGGGPQPNVNGADFTAMLTSTIAFLVNTGNLSIKALYNPAPAAADQGVFAIGSGFVSANTVAFTTVPFFGPILTLATGNQNGTLYLFGPTPFTSNPGGTSTFTPDGTNATVIYAGAAQAVYGAVYQNLTLTNSGTKTITNLTVTVNGTLSMQGPGNASAAPIYGPNAVLQYTNGSVAQTNGPELPATVPNLAICNPNGVTFTNSTTVSNALTLGSGKVITRTNRIIIGTNGWISGGSSNNYVSGNLQKNFSTGTQTFVFPVGNSEYAPVSVSNLSVIAAGSIMAYSTNGAPPQIASSGINTNQDVNRYWVLTNSSGTFGTYNASFNYPAADVKSGATPAGFAVSIWNSGAWSYATVSGTPTTNVTSIAGQSGFGTFVIGDTLVSNQTITFPSPGNQTYGVAPITLTATASSGLPVSYGILSGPAMVSSNILTLTGAGSVTIQASQSGNPNWNPATPVNQTISVAQKTVTGSFTANNKQYSGTTNASIASLNLSGVINSDVVTLSATGASFTNKNVGNGKTVIATGLSLGGGNAGNYVLASMSATNTANITPVTLTVSADNKSRPYGANNPALTASYSGFVNGEGTNVLGGSPNLSTAADTNSPPGIYTIQISAGSLSATNYSFSFVNGTLTVDSLPSILSIQYVAGSNSVILSASGLVPSSTYHVLASTNFQDWPEIGTAQSTAGGVISYTNSATAPAQFYRIYGP